MTTRPFSRRGRRTHHIRRRNLARFIARTGGRVELVIDGRRLVTYYTAAALERDFGIDSVMYRDACQLLADAGPVITIGVP